MLAYYPVVHATKVKTEESMEDPAEVVELFGDHAIEEITAIIESRFNMDGMEPAGRRVGLLDSYQLWCYAVDPFRDYLTPPPMAKPHIAYFIDAMDFYPPPVDDYNKELRQQCHPEFDKIFSQQDIYKYKFTGYGVPPPFTTGKSLLLQDVIAWVERFGNANGRLRFFSGHEYESTIYHRCVARPLLSLKTTGSISVERAAKPLKNGVASKDRNRLSHDKRLMCLKVGLNLNLKMRLHTEFVGKSDTSWNDLDEGCIV